MGKTYRIGTRFCGGCNCYFDREVLYQRLIKGLSECCDFFHYSEGSDEKSDLVLLINGCQSECLLTTSYDARVLLINNKNYDQAELLIREYLKLNEK
ncbi:MAG: hypothetical protein HFE75_15185 [Firmicutes bacterium]|nr:hypothetical protein [Bacillota bacterium]NBI64884.1 hypothetical protein [Clostridiales bacterium]